MTGLRTERARFLVECLDLPGATGVEDAKWEGFQLSHLNDDSTFRIEDKARQIAWSWLSAAEGVASAILDGRGSIYVSINQREAQEKIRYAREVYEHLQLSGLPRLVRETRQELELENGARLISLPSRAPRGLARMNFYGDEFAHLKAAREIYTGAVPVISKGGGWLRLGSSLLGASGLHWEISTQSVRPYPGYSRKRTPWWEVQAFCLNVREASTLAPTLSTDQRVDLFGNDRIKAIFANMPLEDFQQEYEAVYVDEASAWIPWPEIQANQDPELVCELASARERDLSPATTALDRLAELVRRQQVELAFSAGVDVGRTTNATEMFVVGISPSGTYPLRLGVTMQSMDFDDQEGVIGWALSRLPITRMLIDRTGIGRHIAENLQRRFPGVAQGVDFTNPTKELWATRARMVLQQRKAPLPVDREIAYQIHSIKRTRTASNNLVFDTERDEKHHADKFWAWALAVYQPTAQEGGLSVHKYAGKRRAGR